MADKHGEVHVYILIKKRTPMTWTSLFACDPAENKRPNGPDIAHLYILPQLGQNQISGYCDIIIFMFWTVLVQADSDHLAVPNYRIIKMISAKIIETQSW